MRGRVTATASFPYVCVRGGPFERGRQHGAACGDLVRRYPRLLLRQINERPAALPGQAMRSGSGEHGRPLDERGLFGRARAFLPFFEEFAPHLVEEIAGVARGAGASFDEALVVNVRGELANDPHAPVAGCTAFSLAPPATAGSVLLGQNSDQDPEVGELAIVLHVVPDEGPEMLMFSFGGLVGYHGMNEAGIAHGATSLADGSWRLGLPHYPFKRLLLECETLDRCIELAQRLPFTSSGGYVLADRRGRVVALEIVPQPGDTRVLADEDGIVVHTNHFLHPDLVPRERLLEQIPDSPKRLEDLRSVVLANPGRLDAAFMQRALARHTDGPAGICRHEPQMSTVASFVADVTAGELHVCRGNPCTGSYSTYRFAGGDPSG
jgi:isopenicillin-N N-acyltransferase like protein